MTPLLFDRTQVRRNRLRAAPKLREHDFLIDKVQDMLAERLALIKRDFPQALQAGTTDRRLASQSGIQTLTTLGYGVSFNVEGDEEHLPFEPQSFDLVVSTLSLHTINDLPGALIQARRALRPDGLFLCAFFGGETLKELRDCLMNAEVTVRGGASPRISPFADRQQVAGLMQRAGFALPVVDSEMITVSYGSMTRLMHDLRGMGESNAVTARPRNFARRSLFAEAEKLYRARYAGEDGLLNATFEIIFAIGWAPHESQQQPLKRGSATHRLSDILE